MSIRTLITLDKAVAEIKQACQERTGASRSPFFFLVGAGISTPSIPLAGTIRDLCKETARSIGRLEEPKKGAGAGDEYSHWFTAAYPHRLMRQEFLRKLIKDKPITHANFRLADLLIQGRITSIAVTPNFDD